MTANLINVTPLLYGEMCHKTKSFARALGGGTFGHSLKKAEITFIEVMFKKIPISYCGFSRLKNCFFFVDELILDVTLLQIKESSTELSWLASWLVGWSGDRPEESNTPVSIQLSILVYCVYLPLIPFQAVYLCFFFRRRKIIYETR